MNQAFFEPKLAGNAQAEIILRQRLGPDHMIQSRQALLQHLYQDLGQIPDEQRAEPDIGKTVAGFPGGQVVIEKFGKAALAAQAPAEEIDTRHDGLRISREHILLAFQLGGRVNTRRVGKIRFGVNAVFRPIEYRIGRKMHQADPIPGAGGSQFTGQICIQAFGFRRVFLAGFQVRQRRAVDDSLGADHAQDAVNSPRIQQVRVHQAKRHCSELAAIHANDLMHGIHQQTQVQSQ